MSSETDHPRQRTVAELLAQHGEANATGRRRRRESDGSEEGGAAPVSHGAPAVPDWPAPTREPDRELLRERVPQGQRDPGGRRRADPEPGSWEPEPPSWESRRAPEPQAWDSGPQPWDSSPQARESGPQAWQPSDWDAPARDDRREAQPPPRQTREREQRGWEPEPSGPEPRAWDSGPQAWDSRPWEPQPREPQPREPQPREVQPREVQPREAQPREAQIREAQIREPQPRDASPRGAAAGSPVRDRPTEHIPRIRDENPAADVSLTAPMQPHLRPGPDGYESDGYESDGYDSDGYESDGYDHDDDDEGPPTMVGAAPAGAEAWHRDRTRGRQDGAPADDDGGPPTEAAAPLDFDDGPAGLGGRGYDQSDSFSDGFEDFYGGGQDELPPVHRPDRARNGRARSDRDQRFGAEPEPGGFFDSGESEAVEDDEHPSKSRRQRLTGAVADSASQAWAAVLAQWIAGAVGGAALWVGFRFLWRSLPVVALAAAVLVTVGLVVVVRALLRNDDVRTTMFAVLVGLLLTASPAILVLLGR